MYFYYYFLVCNYSVGRWENRKKWVVRWCLFLLPYLLCSMVSRENQDFYSCTLKSCLVNNVPCCNTFSTVTRAQAPKWAITLHCTSIRKDRKPDKKPALCLVRVQVKRTIKLQTSKDCSYYLHIEDIWPGQESAILSMSDINKEFSLFTHMRWEWKRHRVVVRYPHSSVLQSSGGLEGEPRCSAYQPCMCPRYYRTSNGMLKACLRGLPPSLNGWGMC